MAIALPRRTPAGSPADVAEEPATAAANQAWPRRLVAPAAKMPRQSSFSETLAALTRLYGATTSDLAAIAAVSSSTIRRWLAGAAEPRWVGPFAALSDFFDVPVEEIRSGDVPAPDPTVAEAVRQRLFDLRSRATQKERLEYLAELKFQRGDRSRPSGLT